MSRSTGIGSTTGHRTYFARMTAAKSWAAITNGLPDGQAVTAVRADPVRPGLLYVGNETSVFVSFDDGDNWQPLRQNFQRPGRAT